MLRHLRWRLRWKLREFSLWFRPQERRRIQARADKYLAETRDLVERDCIGGPLDGKCVKCMRTSTAVDFPWLESLVAVFDPFGEGPPAPPSIGRVSYRVGVDGNLHWQPS